MASHDHHDDVFREFGKQFDIDAKAHAHDEPKLGGEVPAGVRNGIAQVTSVKIDRYKTGTMQGKPYGMISCRVVFPDQAPCGTPILDLPVRFGPYPLCETGSGDRYVSAADNLGEFQMALKALLGKSASPEAVNGSAALQKTIAFLSGSKFYTRFRSWAFGKETIEQLPNGKWAVHVDGKPSTRTTTQYPSEQAGKTANPYAGREPRVNYDLLGRVEWQEAATPAGSGVRVASPPPPANPLLGDDIDGPTESAKIASRIVSPPPPAAPAAAPPKGPGRPKKVATAPVSEPEPDVNELADRATNSPDPVVMRGAQGKLTELAKAAGVPEDAGGNLISEDASWQDVADRITYIKGGGSPDGPDADGGVTADDGAGGSADAGEVVVGSLYVYTTANAQGRTVEKEVEVLALFDGGSTAEVRDNQTGKVLMDPKTKGKLRVPVANLSPVPM